MVYPFNFLATIGDKVTTEKRTVNVHTATRRNMDLEMNVEKVEQANPGRIRIWTRGRRAMDDRVEGEFS